MSTYAYHNCKIVDEVVFRRTANGALRAYVHACPDVEQGKIEEVKQSFRGAQYDSIPFTLDGKPVVEVRGFKRESELLTRLHNNGFVDDQPTITHDKSEKNSWGDLFRKRSMQLSGAAMMVADLGFISYGHKNKCWEDTLAGLSYLAGSTTLLTYGRNDQSMYQIRHGAEAILQHAREKGYAIAGDTSALGVGGKRKESVLRQVDGFFRQHPGEIGNMLYVAAGALIGKAALQHRAYAKKPPEMALPDYKDMRTSGFFDAGLGSVTMASGLTATFVKEKAKDPDEKKQIGLGSVVDWVRESPLRAAGYGYIVSTLLHTFSTYKDTMRAKRILDDKHSPESQRKDAKDHMGALKGRIVFVVATLIGEVLLSISSKGHGEGVVSDNTVDDSIVAVAAELIIKQPKHMQETLIQEMGKFLGMQNVLALKDQEAVDRLRRQVEEMRCNPWATKIPESSPDAEKPKPVAVAAEKVAAGTLMPAAWQTKMAVADKGQPLGTAV